MNKTKAEPLICIRCGNDCDENGYCLRQDCVLAAFGQRVAEIMRAYVTHDRDEQALTLSVIEDAARDLGIDLESPRG